MTHESEDEHEITEGDGPYEKGLWAEARHWFGALTLAFGNVREIALVGLSRRMALRCKNWLWSIEGIVRRLIIAAAMALDPESLPARVRPKAGPASRQQQQQQQQQQQSGDPPEPQRPSSAFRVFAVHRKPGARNPPRVLTLDEWVALGPRTKRKPPPPPPEHRHLAFPADGLLMIGAAAARRPGKRASMHRINPLDRRGRVSRWDPDYTYDEAKEAASYSDYVLGRHLDRRNAEPRPPRRERKHRDIHDPFRFGSGGGMEWRRIAQEWDRIIPAPDIAGRILALARVMASPERWIERVARQLKANARLAALIRAVPAPRLEKPRRDRTPVPFGLDCLGLCHAAIARPDTS